MRNAKGINALGRCGKCGDKVHYQDLMSDGHFPGLRVCPDCRDIKHPAERPFRSDEGIALRRPAPDGDDDSPGAGVSLASTLTGGYFGGGT